MCDIAPNIKNISLLLYKEYCENILFKRRFHYYFLDGSDINVEFREWGVYHMLSIQHINNKIPNINFFDKINEGLSFSDFNKNNALKNRFQNQKERIAMFSCIYNTLRNGNVFYIANKKVPNTKNVSVDYLMYRVVGTKGMNVGFRYDNGCFVPITILISKQIDIEKYIKGTEIRIVKELIISNIDTGKILEKVSFEGVLIETAVTEIKSFNDD